MNLKKRSLTRLIIKIIAITLGGCLLLLLITPFIALPLYLNRHIDYKGTFSEKYPMQDIYKASDYNLEEAQAYLTTKDDLTIWISEITAKQPKAVIIYLSGIVQPSVTYFYGHAKYMQENGYASILLEVRGHGNSEGKRICLGYEEANDVRAVVDFIKGKPEYKDVPIILHGVSMGGAASINAFGQISEIDGLIAMSAYSSFEDVVIDIMDGIGIPKFIQQMEKPIITTSLKLIYGSDLVNNIKPIIQIKNAGDRPVLLVACTGDVSVPYQSTIRLSKENPQAEVWIRDSWEHFIVNDCDFKNMEQDTEYCNKILDFLNRIALENK